MFKKLRWHIILIELGAFLFITVLIVAAINIGLPLRLTVMRINYYLCLKNTAV